jgi:hypothetical protein
MVRRLIYLLLLNAVLVSGVASVAHAQNERLVLAFYYAWFDQATWKSGQLSDQPAQPYDSRDRATVQRHVAQARSAGIDALVQSWYGPSGGANNMTESNFATLLDVSAASGLRAAVDFETQGPFFNSVGDVQSALATLLAGHARHPAYLKVNGKPVVFFWRQQRFGVDAWAAIRQQVDPEHESLWIAEGTDLAYLRVFDGIHLYSVAWSADPTPVLVNFGAKVRKAAQDLGGFRYWVATAMPGYDDTRLRGAQAGGFARPRANGDYFRATFSGAAKSGADWTIITSFNEWLEGSMIEPSTSYGDTYLNLTRDLAAAYRAGAVIAPTVAPAASPTATTGNPKGLADSLGFQAMPTLSASSTPMPTATATPTATASPTCTATSTSTPMPTATASATATASPTLQPSPLPTDTPTPTETPPIQPQSGLDSVPPGMWVVAGGVALLIGMALGGVWSSRRAIR